MTPDRRANELDLDEVRRAIRPELLLRRAVGAAMLRRNVYEEIEADPDSFWQAAVVMTAGWVGLGIFNLRYGDGGITVADIATGFLGAIFALGGYAWSVLLVGTTYLRGRDTRADFGEVYRTLGFATAPLVVLAVAPPVWGSLVFVWVFAATVVAVRAALDIGTFRAIVVALVSSVVLALLEATVGAVLSALVG